MIEENGTMNDRGGKKLPKAPAPAERLEMAETAFEEREVEPTALDVDLEGIEASAMNADAKLKEAEENIRRVEQENAFTPAEMDRFQKLTRRREENTGRFKRLLLAAREKVFGKKEIAPESKEASELAELTNNRLETYRNEFNADLLRAEKAGLNMEVIRRRFVKLINESENAFNKDPKGTLANVLENIGVANPDQTAEQAWSIGQAGPIFKKFIGVMRLASRWEVKPPQDEFDIDIEEALPATESVTGVEQALSRYGIKTEKQRDKAAISGNIEEAISESRGTEAENPLINEINGWRPNLSADKDEKIRQLISLRARWREARQRYEKNTTPESIKAAIKTYLELMRGKAASDEEAEKIWSAGQGGAVIGAFDMRLKDFYEKIGVLVPDFERQAMMEERNKAEGSKTVLEKKPRKKSVSPRSEI